MTDERPEERPVTQEEKDAARYLMDAVNLHVQASRAAGREKPGLVAIRLSDGKSPTGDLYDTWADAVRLTGHDPRVFFIRVGKDTIPFRAALLQLQMHRMAYKRGVVLHQQAVIVPQLTELVAGFLPRTLKGLNQDGGLR
jgi:hypothetical protein